MNRNTVLSFPGPHNKLCLVHSIGNHCSPFVCSQIVDMEHYDIGISSFPGVWFSLNGTTYQNNSNVSLEDISEGDDALLCLTNYTACCRSPYTGKKKNALGNWFFPNGSRVPSSGRQWDFHRTRDRMVVRMHCRRGGVEGIYRCEIPDAINVTKTIYIGVYSASTGEWHVYRVYN